MISSPKPPSWRRSGGRSASPAAARAPPPPQRSLQGPPAPRRLRWGTRAMPSWRAGCSPRACSTSLRPPAPPPPEPAAIIVAAWLDLEVPAREACCRTCSCRCASLFLVEMLDLVLRFWIAKVAFLVRSRARCFGSDRYQDGILISGFSLRLVSYVEPNGIWIWFLCPAATYDQNNRSFTFANQMNRECCLAGMHSHFKECSIGS